MTCMKLVSGLDSAHRWTLSQLVALLAVQTERSGELSTALFH